MLQERIEELYSGILDIIGNQVDVMGFYSPEMLMDHLRDGRRNNMSYGVYPLRELDFSRIKDNALLIVMKDGEEIGRHQYVPIYKDTMKYKNEEGKNSSLTFTIRKSKYSDHYHFLSEKISRFFDSKGDIANFLNLKFNYTNKDFYRIFMTED